MRGRAASVTRCPTASDRSVSRTWSGVAATIGFIPASSVRHPVSAYENQEHVRYRALAVILYWWHFAAMPETSNRARRLAEIDQLIIRREINLTRLLDEQAELQAPAFGWQRLQAAIITAKAALERLHGTRARCVDQDL